MKTTSTRRYRRNPDDKRSVTYRAQIEPLIRTLTPDTLVEHDNGDVEVWFNDRKFPFRIESKNVIAVDGVKRKRGDSSQKFSRTIPTPKSVDKYKHPAELYEALKSSRTLRTAVEYVREKCASEGGSCVFHRDGSEFDFVPLYDERGHVTLRDKSEFTGNGRWDQKERESVSRRLFDALVEWSILDEPFKIGHGKGVAAEARWLVWLNRETFTKIARDIFEQTGTGLRTLDSPVWRWFGMDEQAVERAFFDAHQFRLLEYWRSGFVVSLKFLDREAETNGRGRMRRRNSR